MADAPTNGTTAVTLVDHDVTPLFEMPADSVRFTHTMTKTGVISFDTASSEEGGTRPIRAEIDGFDEDYSAAVIYQDNTRVVVWAEVGTVIKLVVGDGQVVDG